MTDRWGAHAEMSAAMSVDILGARAKAMAQNGEATTAAAFTWFNDKLSDADMWGSAAPAELKGGKE